MPEFIYLFFWCLCFSVSRRILAIAIKDKKGDFRGITFDGLKVHVFTTCLNITFFALADAYLLVGLWFVVFLLLVTAIHISKRNLKRYLASLTGG